MQFFSWRLVRFRSPQWENHVFPENISEQSFTSLCGKYFGALNGENKNDKYCHICAPLYLVAEEKAQAEEKIRIENLELKRPQILREINDMLNNMSISRLVDIQSLLSNS